MWPVADPELDALFLSTIGTAEGRRDPYPAYTRLRMAAPVYRTAMGFFVCTRYWECQFVLRDPRFGKGETERSERLEQRFGHLEVFPRLEELLSDRPSLLFLNPPDHTRLRGLVSKAFTPRTVERLRPEIVSLVDRLLDEVPLDEEVDAMDLLAFPLPVAVIGSMLGVPEKDWERFRSVMARATLLLEPVIDDSEIESALLAQAELADYFRALVSTRRRSPADDLLSGLVRVEEGSDRLSEDELIVTAILIFGAGFETTTNLIGNGLLALLCHPGQLEQLRTDREDGGADGSAMRLAIDELLRFDSPVQIDGRHTFEDADVGPVAVPKGSEVITVLGAANRDPTRFERPDTLDLHRDEGPPLSFGSGIHYCLGAALARAEGQVMFDRILARFPRVELAAGEPQFRDRITLRGLEELRLVFSS